MTEPKLRPLTDHLIIEPTQEDERTESGLYIPETAKEKPQRGVVIAVGPGKRNATNWEQRIPVDVKEGDEVLFAKYGGTLVSAKCT